MILEPTKIKSATVSTFSPSVCMKWWDQMPWSYFSKCWVLSQLFHSPLSSSSRCSLVPLHFLPLKWYHLHTWSCDISPRNLNSSLWFIQSGLSRYALSIEVKVSRVTICSLDILLSLFWTSQLFHVSFFIHALTFYLSARRLPWSESPVGHIFQVLVL